MKWAAGEIQNFGDAEIEKVLEGNYLLNIDFEAKGEDPVYINAEDVEISTNEIPGFEVAVKGPLTVALDLILTPELENEGFAREFINRIQNIRKESEFELTDKIVVNVQEKGNVKNIITEYNEYIRTEILAETLEFNEEVINGTEIEVNNDTLTVKVKKAN